VRRRRIAFVTPMHFSTESYVGGGERYPLNMARGIVAADSGLSVEVIAIGEVERRIALQPRLELRVLPVTLRGVDSFDHISAWLPGLLENVDLVHVHQAYTRPSQLAILVAKFLGKPLALTDHGVMTNRISDAVRYTDFVDLLVFQSAFAATQIGGGRRRVTIPGGVDDRFFRPSDNAVRREFVLFVGRLLPHKGIDRLLCALPPDLPCVVVGRPYDDGYARYVRALAAGRDVRFVDDADDLALRELYRRAWVTVVPSVHRDLWGRLYQQPELMGFTALESMACGTPALVSDSGALHEFIRDGETGFVFRGLAELRNRLRAFADGDLNSDAIGNAARRVVESEYSLGVVGDRLLDSYADLWAEET
jgi:glycosyltransferase involved in cell wall biosynthesis